MNINQAYNLADVRSDAGDQDAADAINFCAATAEQRDEWLARLAFACMNKSAGKRLEVLTIVMMERDASGESNAKLPYLPARK